MAPEPRVVAEDLIRVLNRHHYFAPRSGRDGEPLAPLAERAATSTKTLSAILRGKYESVELGLADRLCVALGENLNECRLDPPDAA